MVDRDPALMDWRVYADATCAGMCALIPIPGLDMIVEMAFRRRMTPDIARARGVALDARASRALSKSGPGLLSVAGCLLLPVMLVKAVLKRVFRKIVYIFAVADAVDQLSFYWHRAFLLDHLIRAGHASPGVHIRRTAEVFQQVLQGADTSGLRGVAKQLVVGANHVPSMLRRARRGDAAEVTPEQEEFLRTHWAVIEASLRKIAVSYNEAYALWEEGEEKF